MSASRLHLSPPHQTGDELAWLQKALDSNYLAPLGPMVEEFERQLAAYTGNAHCVTLSSGTAALHLALEGVNVEAGDKVIASTLTFLGGIGPISYLGATPVFMDCTADTWTIDPALVEEELKTAARTGTMPKAILATDLYGQSCDLDALLALGDHYGVPVVVDAAEALGTRYKDRHAGAGARASILSFNGNKIITTSGGGALLSNDKSLIDRARYLSQQARQPVPYYEHTEVGYNYRMSNLLAAVGIAQLAQIEERVAKRRMIFARYKEQLSSVPGIGFMPEASYGRCTHWLSVSTIDSEKFGMDCEGLRQFLDARNIEARPIWKPMHLQPVFADAPRRGGAVSEALFANGLCLPSGSQMTDADIDRVVEAVREAAQ